MIQQAGDEKYRRLVEADQKERENREKEYGEAVKDLPNFYRGILGIAETGAPGEFVVIYDPKDEHEVKQDRRVGRESSLTTASLLEGCLIPDGAQTKDVTRQLDRDERKTHYVLQRPTILAGIAEVTKYDRKTNEIVRVAFSRV